MNDDTISRRAAIDEIEMLLEQSEDDGYDKTWNDAIRGSINAIKHHVPSVQTDISEYSDKLWKLAYERGKRDAQANIVQCEDCKWRRNQNGTMAWIPCRALVTPDDFYCKYAERKDDE